MSVLTAIEQVLTSARMPLHYEEITRRILENGLWQTDGKTPQATVNAQLAMDIKRRGRKSRFQRTDRGVFALRAWGLSELKQPQKKAGKARPPAKRECLSFTDATEQVLEKWSGRKPMHYRDVAETGAF